MLSSKKARIKSDEAAHQWLEISCRDLALQQRSLSNSVKPNWRASCYHNYKLCTAALTKTTAQPHVIL